MLDANNTESKLIDEVQ